MNDFKRDNAWQQSMRDAVLACWYGRHSLGGRYVFMDKGRLASLIQKRYAVDTIVQGKENGAVCIEEKIVRLPSSGRPHTAYFLETRSCTKPGHESDGWMVYGQADYLLYCFETPDHGLCCHLMDFVDLKEWFWAVYERFRAFRMRGTLNETEGRLVPFEDVRRGVFVRVFTLPPAGAREQGDLGLC